MRYYAREPRATARTLLGNSNRLSRRLDSELRIGFGFISSRQDQAGLHQRSKARGMNLHAVMARSQSSDRIMAGFIGRYGPHKTRAGHRHRGGGNGGAGR